MTDQITLLMVEDEPLILMGMQEALEDGGYTVVTALSGADAVAILDQRSGELSGMITDIRLGEGPDGWELARHARSLRPDLPIVYATGDAAHEWTAEGVPHSSVIQKPYTHMQLLTAISALLIKD